MIIYVDLIIILNFFIDFLLLIGTDILLKRNISFKRIILGSLIGSVSTLLLFYINDNLTLIIYKLLISILMIIITFKYQSFNYFKDNLLWLYILSIILGGGMYLLSNSITLSNKGLIFTNNGLEINLIFLIILTPLIIYKYIKQNKKFIITYSNYYHISIYIKDEVINEVGFLDTGNNLKDPFFNRPIILVDKNLINTKVNSFLIPYNTINSHSLLEVFKPNRIVINNKVIKKVLIGITNVNIDGIKIILNKEAL